MTRRGRPCPALLVATVLMVAACTGGGRSAEPPTGPSSEDTNTPADTAQLATGETPADSSPPLMSLRDLASERGIGKVILQPTDEPSSHPTLVWSPLAGASTYWLVLHDSTGRVAWAWSGTTTSVRVGGGDVADLNQTATVNGEMTWSVLALDDSGRLVGLSERRPLTPAAPKT